MGKRVLVPDHPSNVFFKQFTNALLYTSDDDFATKMSQARAAPCRPAASCLRVLSYRRVPVLCLEGYSHSLTPI